MLLGCSSPAALRKATPDLEVQSAKTANAVATCIADRWENGGVLGQNVPVNMRPTSTGYTLNWINGMGGVGLLADVDNASGGSRTRFFTGGAIGTTPFANAVRSCQ